MNIIMIMICNIAVYQIDNCIVSNITAKTTNNKGSSLSIFRPPFLASFTSFNSLTNDGKMGSPTSKEVFDSTLLMMIGS